MTNVTIYTKSSTDDIVGFRTEGHAGYADAGYDISVAAKQLECFYIKKTGMNLRTKKGMTDYYGKNIDY